MTLQSTSSKGRGLPEGGKARRVYLHLHEEIMRGVYAAGAVLPGEQKLAVTLDVSRVTVRRALDALEGDGLISRRAGSGTTVCAPKVQPALQPPPQPPADRRSRQETAALHQQILSRLGPAPLAEDQLIRDLASTPRSVGPALVELELDGRIQRCSGGMVTRVS